MGQASYEPLDVDIRISPTGVSSLGKTRLGFGLQNPPSPILFGCMVYTTPSRMQQVQSHD